jgi:hypothetical protein
VHLIVLLRWSFLNCFYWVWISFVTVSAAVAPSNADSFDCPFTHEYTSTSITSLMGYKADIVQVSPTSCFQETSHTLASPDTSAILSVSLSCYTALGRHCQFWGILGIQKNVCDIDKAVFPSQDRDNLNLAEIPAGWYVSVRIPTLREQRVWVSMDY